MTKIIKQELIHRLADGHFISGQDIADELGVSRAAISKQIKLFADMGLDVFSVKGKGYKLSEPLDLLAKDRKMYWFRQKMKYKKSKNMTKWHLISRYIFSRKRTMLDFWTLGTFFVKANMIFFPSISYFLQNNCKAEKGKPPVCFL